MSFVNTCHQNNYFHLAIHPDNIIIEPFDYTITDSVEKNQSLTLRQYHFRFINFLNLAYFIKLDDDKYQLESVNLMEELS